jgi:hypothetical protein
MNVKAILLFCFFFKLFLILVYLNNKKENFKNFEHFFARPLNCKEKSTTSISIDSLPINVSSSETGITDNTTFLKLIKQQFFQPATKTDNIKNMIPELLVDELEELESSVRFRFTLFLSKINNELKDFICNHIKLSSVKEISETHLMGKGEAIIFKKGYSSYAKHIDLSFEIIKQTDLSEGFRLLHVDVKGLIPEDKLNQTISGIKSVDPTQINEPFSRI